MTTVVEAAAAAAPLDFPNKSDLSFEDSMTPLVNFSSAGG